MMKVGFLTKSPSSSSAKPVNLLFNDVLPDEMKKQRVIEIEKMLETYKKASFSFINTTKNAFFQKFNTNEEQLKENPEVQEQFQYFIYNLGLIYFET